MIQSLIKIILFPNMVQSQSSFQRQPLLNTIEYIIHSTDITDCLSNTFFEMQNIAKKDNFTSVISNSFRN